MPSTCQLKRENADPACRAWLPCSAFCVPVSRLAIAPCSSQRRPRTFFLPTPRVLGNKLEPNAIPPPFSFMTLGPVTIACLDRARLFVRSSALRALLVRALLDRQQRGVLRLQNTMAGCFIARSLFTLDVGSLVAFFNTVFCALLDPPTTLMTLLPWHSRDYVCAPWFQCRCADAELGLAVEQPVHRPWHLLPV